MLSNNNERIYAERNLQAMDSRHKFPEGTLFAGENAFIPIPESQGGGFKMVKLEDFDGADLLSDNLGAEETYSNGENKQYVGEIGFDIDYKKLNASKMSDFSGNSNKIKTDVPQSYRGLENGDSYNVSEQRNLFYSAFPEKSDDEIHDCATDDAGSESADKNIHAGHRERLKKRYDKLGLEGFEDHEVLEFLLYFTHSRRDTNPIAHALINEFGSLERALKADRKFLEEIDGVGKKSSLLISFCHQLILYLNSKIPEKLSLASAAEAGKFCCRFFKDRTEETFAVLMLDTKRTLQNVVIISKGTENETAYYPRNVVKEVVKHKANVVVIAHNHTGNSVHPSDNDIFITGEISRLLDGIGVPLLDHIICCGDRFTSLAERNLISNKYEKDKYEKE